MFLNSHVDMRCSRVQRFCLDCVSPTRSIGTLPLRAQEARFHICGGDIKLDVLAGFFEFLPSKHGDFSFV